MTTDQPLARVLDGAHGRSRRRRVAAILPISEAENRTVTLLDLSRGLELTRVVWRPAGRSRRRRPTGGR